MRACAFIVDMNNNRTGLGVFLLACLVLGACGVEIKYRARRSVDVDKITPETGVINPTHATAALETADEDIKQSESVGSTYIRWGRTTCEGESELVYKGVAGGSQHNHVGGGANYLCLTSDPLWGDYNDAVASLAFVYGAEYQTGWPLHDDNIKGNTHVNQDVPCAVCWTRGRSSNLMIPGRNECEGEGWHLEYHGYLMAAHHKHQRSEYVCMDLAPEADPAGYENKDGALFYYVEGACGSLPCPPYVNGREITCVVCSK